MKIAIVTEYYYPSLGGITEHVHHFAKELKRLGHEPVIITGNAGDSPFLTSNDFEVVRIGKSVPFYSNGSIAKASVGFSMGRKLKRLFKERQFDIIHIHPAFVPTLPILANRYANTTTVTTLHTQFDSNMFLSVFRKIAQYGIEQFDGRIAVSKLCVDSFSKYLKADFKIIPNGIDTDNFNGDHEKIGAFDDEKINIFFLSRLEPRCGLGYLIEAFGMLAKKRTDLRLIIGGDGPFFNQFKKIVPEYAKKSVHFIGRIEGVRPNYYSTADIFCFPTTRASFGITLLEAMASKKPVVAFTLPAYEGIITGGKDGILCGEFRPENLASAIESLADSPEKREEIGKNARVRAMDFSWHKVTKDILDYYDEIKRKKT